MTAKQQREREWQRLREAIEIEEQNKYVMEVEKLDPSDEQAMDRAWAEHKKCCAERVQAARDSFDAGVHKQEVAEMARAVVKIREILQRQKDTRTND